MKSKYQFIIFSLNGTVGLFVDLIVLFYVSTYLNPFLSRMISFFAAVIVTWILNRNITFKQKNNFIKDKFGHFTYLLKEFKYYFFANLLGGIINLSAYTFYIRFYLDPADKYIATVLGGFAGLISNFILSKIIVFKKKISFNQKFIHYSMFCKT